MRGLRWRNSPQAVFRTRSPPSIRISSMPRNARRMFAADAPGASVKSYSSSPSLLDTLAHLLAVEWLWLERWRGRSPQTLPAPEEFPTLAVLSQRWQTLEKAMREYVAGLTEEALECPVTCVSTRGQAWTYPLGRMILHLLHHQSYHRSEEHTSELQSLRHLVCRL